MTAPLQKIEKNLAFIASAGTGKTEQLALRFISLLDYASPDTTLAVTFTKNAAGEILERIIKLLVNAYFDDSKKKKLEVELNLSSPLEKEKLKQWISTIIENLPRLSVSTLDSFFYQIIACYPLELGLNCAPDIAQGYVDRKIQKKVFKQLFARAKGAPEFLASLKEIMIGLTEGKESGKISDRVSDVIKESYEIFLNSPESAWDGLEITSNIDKLPSWKELMEEYLRLVQDGGKNAQKFYYKLKDADFKYILSHGPVKNYLERKKYNGWDIFSEEKQKLLQNIVDYAKAKVIQKANKKTKSYFELLKYYHFLFEYAKLSENMINYSDIYRLLIGSIASEEDQQGLHVYYRLDSRINNFLIDEFQDTNRYQWQAIRPLATEAIQDTDENRTYFMVGDMKQSIYGWRGGDPRLFSEICNNYDIKTETLVESYRAGQNILDIINHIFSCPLVYEWAEEFKFENHISAVEEPGYFEFIETGKDNVDESDALRVSVYELIEKINPTKRGLSTAILFRKSKKLNLMADYLKSNGINCYILGTSPLFQKSVVRRLLSLFELIENPENQVAYFHLSEEKSYLKSVIPKNKTKRHELLNTFKQKLIYDSYANLIVSIVQPLFPQLDEKSISYLEQLIGIAEQYEPLKTANPKNFLTFVEETDVSIPKAGKDIVLSTIHGSKGLGFDIVILPELSGNPKYPDVYTQKGDINLLGDEPEIETVTTLANKELTNAIPELKIIREQYQKDFEKELFNLLYVALTRAKKGLYLFTENRKITKGDKINKFLDVLIPALENAYDEDNTIIAKRGEQDWYNKYPIIEQEEKTVKKQFEKIKLKKKISRFRPYQTPSSLHVINDIIFTSGNRKGKAKGTIIHALFEQIEWLDEKAAKDINYSDYLTFARKVSIGFDDNFYKSVIDEFFDILKKEKIINLLTKPEEKCEVKNELHFAGIVDEKLTNGTFDRVVFFPDADRPVKVEIYDYKTDAVTTNEEIKSAVGNYKLQIECYRKAVEKGYNLGKEKIHAKIVFTTPGEIIEA